MHIQLSACLSFIAALTFLACSKDEVSRTKVPKAAPQPPAEHVMSAPMQAPVPAHALKWTLPSGWTEEKPEGMRFATFRVQGRPKVDAYVVVLQGQAGGELANVNRWRSQIGLDPVEDKELAKLRKKLDTKAGALSMFDFTGKDKSRMVVALLAGPDGRTWFIKMVGDSDEVTKTHPGFMHLLETLHLG
jgi:hypothetical protein